MKLLANKPFTAVFHQSNPSDGNQLDTWASLVPVA
jgi:hypothetical protein